MAGRIPATEACAGRIIWVNPPTADRRPLHYREHKTLSPQRTPRSRSRKAQTGESKTVGEISLRRNLPHSSFSLFWLLSVHSVVSVVKFFRLLRGFVLPGLVPGTPYLTAWANSGEGKKCQESKNDFLASMCPKWVPDPLSPRFHCLQGCLPQLRACAMIKGRPRFHRLITRRIVRP